MIPWSLLSSKLVQSKIGARYTGIELQLHRLITKSRKRFTTPLILQINNNLKTVILP